MFKLNPDPTFKADVEIPVPGQGKGKITITYRYKNAEQMADYMGRLKELGDIGSIMEIVEGWDGPDAPFDETAIKLLAKNYNGSVLLIYQRYVDELTKARLGN
jgi:hypothetical protein